MNTLIRILALIIILLFAPLFWLLYLVLLIAWYEVSHEVDMLTSAAYYIVGGFLLLCQAVWIVALPALI